MAKWGRAYLIGLWAVFAALLGIAAVRMTLAGYGSANVWILWWVYLPILGGALLHAAAAWGVFRRKRWSYYLSIVLCVLWAGVSALGLADTNETQGWIYLLFLAPCGIALIWLFSRGARAQFTPVAQK